MGYVWLLLPVLQTHTQRLTRRDDLSLFCTFIGALNEHTPI